MNAATATAFQNATGQAPGAVSLVFASIVIVVALLWLAWVVGELFALWQARRIDWGDFMAYLVRGAVVLSVLVYFIS